MTDKILFVRAPEMRRLAHRVVIVTALVTSLGGCQYMATSVAVQAVLAGGGQGPYDPSKRITDSQFVKITGAGWSRNAEIHSATYSEGGRGLHLRIFARNGGSGGSHFGKFLIDVQLSNNDESTRGPLFFKQTWVKEAVTFRPALIAYISPAGASYHPVGMAACSHQVVEEFFAVPEIKTISPGWTECVRLLFATDPPPGAAQYQIQIPGIVLGDRALEDTVVTFGLIYG